MTLPINQIIAGDCLEGLKGLPSECCDCCVTSPPYFGLRDYGTALWVGGSIDCDHKGEPMRTRARINEHTDSGGADVKNKDNHQPYKSICGKCFAIRIDSQIGLEKTPELYVKKLVEVFTEVRRVLKKSGTLWLNLGDSYAASGKNRTVVQAAAKSSLAGGISTQLQILKQQNKITAGLKPKDLIGIPWMVAFALRSSGWYLRQDIIEEVEFYCPCGCGYIMEERIWRYSQDRDMIWKKPNPMPESVTDRCTKAHEYIFLLSKSGKYYYDAEAIRTEAKNALEDRRRINAQTWDNKNTPDVFRNGIRPKKIKISGGWETEKGQHTAIHRKGRTQAEYQEAEVQDGANKRSVWTVNTQPYSEAHFATFPEDLVVDMIKAGCPDGGIVLDPFFGAGTTGVVARKLNRNFIGYELNPEYIKIAERRLYKEIGMFL